MTKPLIRVWNLSKHYSPHARPALDDVSFEVRRGESVGILGLNSSGKSTLIKLIAGILRPSVGRIEVRGTCNALVELGAAFHREISGRENVYFNGALLGMGREEVRRRFDAIVSFAGVEERIDLPIRAYSTGMVMRLALSVALHFDSEILLLDEALAAADVEFQHRCLSKIEDYRGQGGTIVIVSHDISHVERLCERSILLERGRVVEDGPTSRVLSISGVARRRGALEVDASF